jgi:hypothetical protein
MDLRDPALLSEFAGNRSGLAGFDQNAGQSPRSGIHAFPHGEIGTDGSADLAVVEAVLREHYHEPDVQAARIVLGAVAAHALDGQPVWMMIVAPPGSMKTELAEALADCPQVHMIDKFTPRTFLSGQIQDAAKGHKARKPSLLHRIGDTGIIVVRDFSTVLGMRKDDLKSVLADFRCIYDGALASEYGTSEEKVAWRGRISCIVCATPQVDDHYSSVRSLGERFLIVRPPRAGREAALRAMNQDLPRQRHEHRAAVKRLIYGLSAERIGVAAEKQEQIVSLAEFVERARTFVPRDYRKQIVGVSDPASPTRLSQQLCQLARGLARLNHRPSVSEMDMDDVRRVGLDCLPAVRRDVLSAYTDHSCGRIPRSTRSYAVEELKDLGLMDAGGRLSALGADLLQRAGFGPKGSRP